MKAVHALGFIKISGSTLRVIFGLDTVPSIVISAVIAVLYTLMGGLVSVAYTDVIQITFITVGLVNYGINILSSSKNSSTFIYDFFTVPGPISMPYYLFQLLSIPYAASNKNVASLDFETTDWKGELPAHLVGEWIDFAFLLLLGGVPWQCYFQRVLARYAHSH